MPDIPKFVVTAGPDGLNALMDLDIDGELDAHPLAGVTGQFTPNLKPGLYPVGFAGLYQVGPIEFTIDTSGKLNGNRGIELLAEVEGVANLQWNISFNRAYVNGKRLDIPGWSFNAKPAGSAASLEELFAVKDTAARWVARTYIAAGGVNDDGDLVFRNDDGSEFTVAIPTGTLALIDNGDSTWTFVGP